MQAVVTNVTTASATKGRNLHDRRIRNPLLAGCALGVARRVFCAVTPSSTIAASGDRSLGGLTPRARTHLCDDETLVDFWPASLTRRIPPAAPGTLKGSSPGIPRQQIPRGLPRVIRHNRRLRARSRPGTPLRSSARRQDSIYDRLRNLAQGNPDLRAPSGSLESRDFCASGVEADCRKMLFAKVQQRIEPPGSDQAQGAHYEETDHTERSLSEGCTRPRTIRQGFRRPLRPDGNSAHRHFSWAFLAMHSSPANDIRRYRLGSEPPSAEEDP